MGFPVKIGIIGGSGLDDPDLLKNRNEVKVDTPFGKPSDVLIEGTISDVKCVLLARHGRGHSISPTNVNYRANIWALKTLGCTHVVVTTACGSLREEIHPGDIVVLDQFIDRTTKRASTFYDASVPSLPGVCHIPMSAPFCAETRKIIINTAEELGIRYHPTGTNITIEGPRFSTKAESNVWRTWGGSVINMTTVPEVVLAREAGLCYAAIALVTDYDCWKANEQSVNVETVMKTFKENATRAVDIILNVIPKIAEKDWTDTINRIKEEVQSSIMLPPQK